MEIKVIEDIQRRARDEEEYMARVKEEQDEKEVKSKGDGEEGGGEADGEQVLGAAVCSLSLSDG